jgi:iron complex transport system permease protein
VRFATALPLVLGASILIGLRARSLNGLLLGEEAAAHLGVDVRRERAILLGLASLATAAAVAVSGLIGFVGLVAPHVVRLLVGPNARLVLPLAAILGASLMAGADLAARLLGEIPVGVVTAVIGAPFFLALLRTSRVGYEL